LAALAALWMANTPPAMADLIGTNVSGVMTIEGFPNNNFFDPVEGFVPAGFGNSVSPINVLIGSGTEFGFQDFDNTDTVNFTGTQVTLLDVSEAGSRAITYSFTNAAFNGATISLVSDNFPSSVTESLVGNLLTLSAQEFLAGGTFQATFNIAPAAVPGPIAGAGLPRPDPGERWASRLVAAPSENRLSIWRNPHSSVLRQLAIAEHPTFMSTRPT
jgi:hypothetical protein